MARKVLSLLAAVLVLTLCSCGDLPSVEGDKLINQARADYRKLDSAKVEMTNMKTNEVEQTFEFKYDEKGFLIYSYEGKNGDEVYAQYNNGAECFTYENGKLTELQKGDDDFGAYTRDVTHPQADEGLIVFNPSAVKKAQVYKRSGIVHVSHDYDVDKLSQENLTDFHVDYCFDESGELLYFIETSLFKGEDKSQEHRYRVEITEKNSVEAVEDATEKYR